MKDILNYKEFIGTVHYSSDDEVFYGKILEIDDLVTFEGKTVEELKKSFNEAVDDYIEICKKNKKEIFKSFKGSFNVRVSPDLHKKAVRISNIMGVSLNNFIQKALAKEVEDNKKLLKTR